MGSLSHDCTAVDAQHDVARIVARAAGDGGGYLLLSTGIGFAADGECDACGFDVGRDRHVDSELVVADGGC